MSTILSIDQHKQFSAFLDSVEHTGRMGEETEAERLRKAAMDKQVQDLQSWCDRNSIIPNDAPRPAPVVAPAPVMPAPVRPQTNGVSTAPIVVKREEDSTPIASTSTLPPEEPAPAPPRRTTKRPRASKARQRSMAQDMDEDSTDDTLAAPSANGQTRLLTDAERRQNHIASEQKRRAAIRDAYDRLSRSVPVLRDALREYEARVAATSAPTTRGSSGRRKKATGASGPLQGGIDVGGEKIDGRAGPKSEAVVLTQTVEYLNNMENQRTELLLRLERAQRIAQSRGLDATPPDPAWQQTWEQQEAERDAMDELK